MYSSWGAAGTGILQNFKVFLDGNQNNITVNKYQDPGASWVTVTTANGPFTGLKFECSFPAGGNGGWYLQAVRVNGKVLADTFITDPNGYKITSKDTDANTITVSGGTWDTSNQSQVWSDYLTSNSTQTDSQGPGGFFPGTPRTNAFDGDLADTYTACTGNPAGDPNRTATITFDATGLGLTITEKVGLVMSASQDVEIVTSDGTFTETNLGALKPLPSEMACTGTLQTIKLTTQDPNLWGIYIDGNLLVDAALDSEVWSTNISGNWSNPQYIFNGDLATIGYGDKGQVNLSTIVAQQSIEAYFYTGNMSTSGTAADQWEINGVNISALHPNQGPGIENIQWVDVSSGFTFPATVSSIRTAQNNQGGMGAIKVDGKLLLDKGARDLGDAEVTYQTKGGKGDVVGVSGSDIYLNTSADTDERWIANEGFTVAGPTTVREPTLTADIELTSSSFTVTPTDPEVNPGVIPEDKRYVWTINGVEQVGVNVNPWKPGNLEVNTQYTVEVRHEDYSQKYIASPESASYTFTTGAARNIRSLYETKIADLQARLTELDKQT